jgi:hypothetical protein
MALLLTGSNPAHAGPARPVLHKLHLPCLPASSSCLAVVLDVPALTKFMILSKIYDFEQKKTK